MILLGYLCEPTVSLSFAIIILSGQLSGAQIGALRGQVKTLQRWILALEPSTAVLSDILHREPLQLLFPPNPENSPVPIYYFFVYHLVSLEGRCIYQLILHNKTLQNSVT